MRSDFIKSLLLLQRAVRLLTSLRVTVFAITEEGTEQLPAVLNKISISESYDVKASLNGSRNSITLTYCHASNTWFGETPRYVKIDAFYLIVQFGPKPTTTIGVPTVPFRQFDLSGNTLARYCTCTDGKKSQEYLKEWKKARNGLYGGDVITLMSEGIMTRVRAYPYKDPNCDDEDGKMTLFIYQWAHMWSEDPKGEFEPKAYVRERNLNSGVDVLCNELFDAECYEFESYYLPNSMDYCTGAIRIERVPQYETWVVTETYVRNFDEDTKANWVRMRSSKRYPNSLVMLELTDFNVRNTTSSIPKELMGIVGDYALTPTYDPDEIEWPMSYKERPRTIRCQN